MAIQTVVQTEESSIATRRLVLHDSLVFFRLFLVTAVLAGVTLFLFRSFTTHRAELAKRWSARAVQSLGAGRPGEAIPALRTALTYAPGEREYEMLLAQALGQAGETDQSYNYFMGLWATAPGDGRINLALARLATKRAARSPADHADRQAAVNFYRAAIYGTWEGDGIARRPQVRLELARYLLSIGEPAQASAELLVVGGNAPESGELDLTVGELLNQAGDPADASAYLRKALARRPHDAAILEAAGRLAYTRGDFESAHGLLASAQAERTKLGTTDLQQAGDTALESNAARILELTPVHGLARSERVAHIAAARTIAKQRYDVCSNGFAASGQIPAGLVGLGARWAEPEATATEMAMRHDDSLADSAMQLVYDTELETAEPCPNPAGDDALLLLAARTAAAGSASQTNSAPMVSAQTSESKHP